MDVSLPQSVQVLVQKIILVTNPAKLVLFGSRARNTHRSNSDIDLCLLEKKCSDSQWNQLLVSIQEDPDTLFKVDLVEFESLSKSYRDEVQKEGVTLYESNA
jgi:predicted nucleotidyltransferase